MHGSVSPPVERLRADLTASAPSSSWLARAAAVVVVLAWASAAVGQAPTLERYRGPGAATLPRADIRPNRQAALACWERLVVTRFGDGADAEAARRAVARLFKTAHGVWLASALCAVLPDPGDETPAVRIEAAFVDEIPDPRTEGVAFFRPPAAGAPRYEVFIRDLPPGPRTEGTVLEESSANPECSIVFLYRENESRLAEALFHELLHVWFVNAFAGQLRRFPTGHGNVDRCELEPEFGTLLDAFARELAALEGVQPVRLLPFGSSWSTGGRRR